MLHNGTTFPTPFEEAASGCMLKEKGARVIGETHPTQERKRGQRGAKEILGVKRQLEEMLPLRDMFHPDRGHNAWKDEGRIGGSGRHFSLFKCSKQLFWQGHSRSSFPQYTWGTQGGGFGKATWGVRGFIGGTCSPKQM